jgi:hypothetical protein
MLIKIAFLINLCFCDSVIYFPDNLSTHFILLLLIYLPESVYRVERVKGGGTNGVFDILPLTCWETYIHLNSHPHL